MKQLISKLSLGGVARVTAVCAFGTVLLTFAAVVKARSDVGEASLRLGESMSSLKDLIQGSSELRINGNTLFAGGRHVPQDLHAVLERFEEHCDVTAIQPPLAPSAEKRVRTLVRHENEKSGVVVCLKQEPGADMNALIARTQLALETGDLSQVGQLRYVLAERAAGGGTDIITVWSEGKLNVRELMPSDVDAAGDDLPEAPRPLNSIRTLQAELVGTAYALRSYMTAQAPLTVIDHYARTMPSRGWKVVEDKTPSASVQSRSFTKAGAALVITAERKDEKTRVDIVQLGSRGHARVTENGVVQ